MAKPIDDSHQPFKRTAKIGPGPRKRPAIKAVGKYTCVAANSTKQHYVQACTYMGADGKRLLVKIKTSKAKKKKAYNKQYRKWAAKARKALTAKGPRPGYKCRKTPSTSCQKKK